MSARRADLLNLLLLLALPLILFWEVTLGGRTLLPADNLYQYQPHAAYRAQLGVPEVPHNALLSDLVLQNWQWKQFIRASLANGELPLWNPYLFAGVPFLAAGQHSALYPFSLIYYVLPLENAYGWFTVSQLWLAGVLMYAFLRGIRLGRFGALIGGIAYQLNSFFIASAVFPMIIAAAIWLPFLLLMCENILLQRQLFGRAAQPVWIVLGALGLGMSILAGHVEFFYYSLLVTAFWCALRLMTMWLGVRAQLMTLIKRGAALLSMVALGVGVGAAQFVPFYELVNASFREGRASFEQILSYGLPLRHVIAFLMPNIYGSPAQHTYFDLFTGQLTELRWQRTDGVVVTDTFMEGGKNYVEGASYAGVLTLILALIGMFSRNPRAQAPYRLLFALISLFSLLFAFGTPLYALLYYGLPGISQLHSPFRWIFPLMLCLAALAAYGAQALQAAHTQPTSRLSRAARWLGYALIGIGVVTLVSLIGARVAYGQVRSVVQSIYDNLAGANLAYPSPEVFFSVKAREIFLFALLVIGSGIVVRASRCPIYLRQVPIWQIGAVLLLSADLLSASYGFNPAADPKWLHFEPPAIAWLRAQSPKEWRLTTYQAPNATATLNANMAWRFGLQDIRGYDSIITRQYVQYMRQIAPQNQLLYNRIAPIYPDTADALGSPYLDLLSVRYVLSEAPLDTARFPHYRLAYQDESVRIYENTRALPRAFVISAALDSVPSLAQVVPAQLERVGHNEVLVRAQVEQAQSALILTDSYANGWRAYIRPVGAPEDAEQEAEIALAYGNFRRVDLPEGEWLVRFRYSPPSFQLGAFASFLSGAIAIFALIVWTWQTFYREGQGETGAVRRFAKNSLAPIVLNLFNRLIDMAFAFIMLRLLGPAAAGTYYYAVVIFGWFDILTNFGLNTLLTREVARNLSAAGSYLLNSSLLRLGLAAAGVPLLVGFLAVRGALSPALDSTTIAAILLLYVGLVPNSISTGLTALLYAYQRAEVPSAVATVTVILKSAAGVAVLLAGFGVIGLAAVSIALNVVTLALLALSVRAAMRNHQSERAREQVKVRRDLLHGMLVGGFPLMLNHLLATVFFKIDVVILEPLQGDAIVGQYSTAYKWLDALGVIPALFTTALLPIMARQAQEDRAGLQRSYHFAVKLLVNLAVPIAVLTTFSASFLVNLLGGARYLPNGAIALQIMAWFMPIGWINSLTNYVLVALDQQARMKWAFLAGVSFNIVTNLLFVPIYGFQAAAVTTILSEVVLLVAFYRLLRRALGTVNWTELLWRPCVAGVCMASATLALWSAMPLAAVLVSGAVYAGVLWLLRPFTSWELGRIALLLPQPLQRALMRSGQ
ncbi:MAG: oligosaccharide flippase family protein [Anaerolineae bacterium]|nr:oligosaccharide flippase family protein [Anaerolineae bacterium]